ncbi:hypothetical protein ASF24_09890 [Methylobacterium sp. Leaf86]|nr:hypothetical protein ASF24_09890 [Methylobacterium sp. Leaf86]
MRLSASISGAELSERLVGLYAAFQEYMVPIVTIETQSVSSVVQIFERVNSTGTRLSSIDFMRAVTWSAEFDLSEALKIVQRELALDNFELRDETLVKALGLVFGLDPLPDVLLTLRARPASELHDGMRQVSAGLTAVAAFVKQNFEIYDPSFIPYEGQILVLFRALLNNEVDKIGTKALTSWYWATGFNEGLRGKPDHYVARAVRSVERSLNDGKNYLSSRLQITAFEFRRRRFIRGSALSATLASMFATNGARSIVSGDIIPAATYMANFSVRNFASIFSQQDVKAIADEENISGKLLANLIVVTEQEAAFASRDIRNIIIERLDSDSTFIEVLKTQFISEKMISDLRIGDVASFLDRRAIAMFDAAQQRV